MISAYIKLIKPRITMMVLLTAYLGYYMGLRSQNSQMMGLDTNLTLFFLLIGTWMTSASAAVLNQVIEWKQDSKMFRTQNRPIVEGSITIASAIIYGSLIGVVGFIVLFKFTNSITAWIAVLTLILYIFVYTPSKKITTWNTVIGSVPGALPPVGGWTAATGFLEPTAWILFGILFCWQMPHFLAIAIIYATDYERGGFKMLPTIYPESRRTSYVILFFTIALLVASLGLYIIKLAGIFYAISVALLGIVFFIAALNVIINTNKKNARLLMVASIVYLPILFVIILIEKLLYL